MIRIHGIHLDADLSSVYKRLAEAYKKVKNELREDAGTGDGSSTVPDGGDVSVPERL